MTWWRENISRDIEGLTKFSTFGCERDDVLEQKLLSTFFSRFHRDENRIFYYLHFFFFLSPFCYPPPWSWKTTCGILKGRTGQEEDSLDKRSGFQIIPVRIGNLNKFRLENVEKESLIWFFKEARIFQEWEIIGKCQKFKFYLHCL